MSERQPVNQDDLLIDLLCDQANEQTQQEFEQMIRQNSKLEAELAQHQRVLGLLTPQQSAEPDADFNRQLWDKIKQPTQSDQPSNSPIRLWRRTRSWSTAGLAAAIIMLCWILPTFMHPADQKLAWADVVAAFNNIQSCHILAFMEDPTSSHEERRLAKLEMYYRSPDLWRGQAFGHVQFRHGKVNKMYDSKTMSFVEPGKSRLRLIPDELVKGVQQGDFLQSVLLMMFDSKDVKRTAVKNTQLSSMSGIEVFDYARDPSQQWARVWVLKESRLPIHIKVYQPRRDEFYDVTFDYTDPQPTEYFDPDSFEEIIKKDNLTKPHEILQAGIKSIASKPVTSIHVAEEQGPEAMPEITRLMGVADGAFMLETMPVDRIDRNMYIERKWLNPKDNWGNTYVWFSSGSGISGRPDSRDYTLFTPVLPFKHGEGKRIMTLQYAVFPGASAMRELDLTKGIITFPVVQREIGFDDLPQIPKRLKSEFKPSRYNAGARSFHQIFWKPFACERYLELENQLATQLSNNQRITKLYEQYNLLNQHRRGPRAEVLMTEKLIPLILKTDPLANGQSVDILARHMVQLYAQQKYDRFYELADIFKSLIDSFSSRAQQDRRVKFLIKNRDHELGQVLNIVDAEKKYANMTLPQLVDIHRSEDGYVLIRIKLPQKSYEVENGRKLKASQMWRIEAFTKKRIPRHNWFSETDPQTLWLIVQTDQQKVALTGRFRMAKSWFSSDGVRKSFPLGTVEVPAKPTIKSLRQWWSEHLKDKPFPYQKSDLPRKPYERLNNEASKAYNQKQYKQAVDLYAQILILPKEDWPEYMFMSMGSDGRTLYQHQCAFIQTRIGRCKIRMGEHQLVLDKIQKQIEQLPSLEPDDVGWVEPAAIYRGKPLREAQLEWPRMLIEQQQFDQAQNYLDEMAKDLPDLSQYLNERMYIRTKTSNGGETTQSYSPRSALRRTWHEYEVVLWDLHDARGKAQQQDRKSEAN